MDKLNTYRELVIRCLSEWEAYICRARRNGIEVQRVFEGRACDRRWPGLGALLGIGGMAIYRTPWTARGGVL